MEKTLQQQINDAIDEIDRIYVLAASRAGLSESAFDILYALYVFGDGCSQKELCERCHIGKQTLNSSVKRLASQGCITLEPGRGRETLVTLTEDGRALAREKIDPFAQAEEAAIAILSEEEQAQLLGLLRRIRDGLRSSLESSGLL